MAAAGATASVWAENSGGTLGLIAQSGTTDAPGTTAPFLTFSDPVYNKNEAVAFYGTLQLIVRTGDVLNVGTAMTPNNKTITGLTFLPAETSVNGQARSFAQGTGDLVYLATFSDKSQAVISVVFP